MGLADIFRDLATNMLTPGGIFDDVPVEATFYSAVEGNAATYDPVTGTVVRNEEAPITITGVPTNPSIRQIDNVNVFPDDKFFLVAGRSFTNAGLSTRRKPGDRLVLGQQTWEVVEDVKTDPVEAVFIFHLRRP
jgi:hypothetical protein